ncbi:MAG TPA: tetratricopeptide repeat protein [Tepidisphaeraceae bacterium]|nr:tetratricopeptide repeat protein [Tepidisphaeraceae bacterium]
MLIDEIHTIRRAGRVPEAITRCRVLVKREPENAEPIHLLGLLLSQTGKIDEAVAWLRKSLSLDPSQERYWQNLVAVLMGAGRIAEAHGRSNGTGALLFII